jgi:hypothetical protein
MTDLAPANLEEAPGTALAVTWPPSAEKQHGLTILDTPVWR